MILIQHFLAPSTLRMPRPSIFLCIRICSISSCYPFLNISMYIGYRKKFPNKIHHCKRTFQSWMIKEVKWCWSFVHCTSEHLNQIIFLSSRHLSLLERDRGPTGDADPIPCDSDTRIDEIVEFTVIWAAKAGAKQPVDRSNVRKLDIRVLIFSRVPEGELPH